MPKARDGGLLIRLLEAGQAVPAWELLAGLAPLTLRLYLKRWRIRGGGLVLSGGPEGDRVCLASTQVPMTLADLQAVTDPDKVTVFPKVSPAPPPKDPSPPPTQGLDGRLETFPDGHLETFDDPAASLLQDWAKEQD